jgi:hypothetical protein
MKFEFKQSNRKDKKYMVKVNNGWIHFGDKNYQHYKDSTGLGLYTYLNHLDDKRRKNYKARHEATRHKVLSASWFADQFLW